MIKKVLSLFIILALMVPHVISSSNSGKTIIRVALLDSFIPSFTSPPEMEEILSGYTWQCNTTYEFHTEWLSDFDVASGKLSEFDVLVIPGIGKEFWRIADSPSLSRWKQEIRSFVAAGGGYFGTCGGANVASSGLLPPESRGWNHWTAWEWFMNRSALGLVPALSYQDMADPVASTLVWKNPARVGFSAYVWYNLSIDGTGICQNCRINGGHPIFHGCENERRLIRWVAGPALIPVAENVTVLAWYPDENISGPYGNKSTSIHAWRYDGLHFKEPLDFWDMENIIIETHIAGKPAAISCTYGEGRVVVFGNHPEHPVWKGGSLYEKDTSCNMMLHKGLFHWKDREFLPEDYNWWVVRRSVAWTACVADGDLPPVEYE